MPDLSQRAVRFGAFEFDLERAELRKQGLRVRLQEQPSQVLAALLERPGEVVSRERLIQQLWPNGTVVDFDRGLNAAVTRLRQALSDSAETPRYVETVARRGYRFVGSVDKVAEKPESANPGPSAPETRRALLPMPSRSRIGLATVSILVLAAAGWLLSRRQDEFGRAVKVSPLTGAAGVERNPSFNPDGTQVVYEWERENGQRHLYLKVVGPGDPMPLTSGPGAEYGPAWSPDGKLIAFLGQEERSKFGVFVIAPVGGTPRKVVDVPSFPLGLRRGHYRRLDWTRDSRHLIVSAFGRPPGWESLLLVSVETGEQTWLTGPPADTMSGDREPAVSPDGTMVAFARGALSAETLYVLPLTSDLRPAGAPRPIRAAGPARSPAWSPDGRRLIFTTLNPGVITGSALSWVGLDTGKGPRHLIGVGNSAATPVLSRQGRLAYSAVGEEGSIWRQDIPLGGEPAPPPVKVRGAAAIQLNAQYSPDGARIAFASEQSGTREIWNCASDGAQCVQVTAFNGPFGTDCPRWSPDGKQIVFESTVEGGKDVYIVDANGGVPRRINVSSPRGGFAYWSHDGKWIYYSSRDKGTREIWRIPAAGGKADPVTRTGGFMPVDSPDSQALYHLKADTKKLFRSAPSGSGETELLSGIAYWGFAVAKDRIYYLHEPSDGSIEIRRLLLATGENSRIALIDKPLTVGLSLSPDGKSLIYSELRLRASLMIADNLY